MGFYLKLITDAIETEIIQEKIGGVDFRKEYQNFRKKP